MKDLTNSKNLNPKYEIGSVHTFGGHGKFDIDNDPDRPKDAINSSVIIEEIDINGAIQKV